jgi:hypothetical protein
MELVGDVGRLKVGHRHVANITDWTVTHHHPAIGLPEVTLTAKVAECDQYWITRSPFAAGVWMGRAWWVWKRTEVIEVNESVVALTLVGNPEAQPEF